MRWLKRGMWKACFALAGLMFVLIFMVWVPLSAGAYAGASVLAMSAPVDTTPTPDLTVTALAKKQLGLQVNQLQNQLENQNNWFVNNSTALIAATATVIVALFGIYQWTMNRRDERRKELIEQDKELADRQATQDKELKDREEERRKEVIAQDKELRDRAEERFQAAVAALGSSDDGTKVCGAVLLRSFLNPEDKVIYGRYYTQIFDLAVAYLRLPNTYHLSINPNAPLSLTPLRLALVAVFKEAFPLARDRIKEQDPKIQFNPQSLEASHVKLDNAYLANADLKEAWMPEASMQGANLSGSNFTGANLYKAILHNVDFSNALFAKADLHEADLRGAQVWSTDLGGANLMQANLSGVTFTLTNFKDTDLMMADLQGAKFQSDLYDWVSLTDVNPAWRNIKDAKMLFDTNLRGVTGLTREQLEACKAKDAIIDEETLANASQPTASPSKPSRSTDTQASSATPLQVNKSGGADGSGSASSKPSAEP